MSTHQSNTLQSNAAHGAKNGSSETQPTAALMTASGLDELRSELKQLRHRYRAEIPEQLREARPYGDDSNNDEYHAVREEELVLEARIRLLQDAIARAILVDPDQAPRGVVAIGATVSIEDPNSRDKSRRYRMASAHAIDGNAISAASPVASDHGGGARDCRHGGSTAWPLPKGPSHSRRSKLAWTLGGE